MDDQASPRKRKRPMQRSHADKAAERPRQRHEEQHRRFSAHSHQYPRINAEDIKKIGRLPRGTGPGLGISLTSDNLVQTNARVVATTVEQVITVTVVGPPFPPLFTPTSQPVFSTPDGPDTDTAQTNFTPPTQFTPPSSQQTPPSSSQNVGDGTSLASPSPTEDPVDFTQAPSSNPDPVFPNPATEVPSPTSTGDAGFDPDTSSLDNPSTPQPGQEFTPPPSAPTEAPLDGTSQTYSSPDPTDSGGTMTAFGIIPQTGTFTGTFTGTASGMPSPSANGTGLAGAPTNSTSAPSTGTGSTTSTGTLSSGAARSAISTHLTTVIRPDTTFTTMTTDYASRSPDNTLGTATGTGDYYFPTAPTDSPQPSGTNAGSLDGNSSNSNANTTAADTPTIVGGVVGGVAGLAIALLLAVILVRWWRRRSDAQALEDDDEPEMMQSSRAAPIMPVAAAGMLSRLSRPLSARRAAPPPPVGTGSFQRLSGRKLPSQFSPGIEGPGPGPAYPSGSSHYPSGNPFDHPAEDPFADPFMDPTPEVPMIPAYLAYGGRSPPPPPVPRTGSPALRGRGTSLGVGRGTPPPRGTSGSRFVEGV